MRQQHKVSDEGAKALSKALGHLAELVQKFTKERFLSKKMGGNKHHEVDCI